jgi:alkylation response protein AidB-like acyl-CoA dehydrogenase
MVGNARDVLGRVAELVPFLAKNARRSDENRRLSEQVIDALSETGVFRLRTPIRYGGYEADTRTLVEIAAGLGRSDGAAWVSAVYRIPTWMAFRFPDHVQEEVFAVPNARICGTLSPSGTAKPAAGRKITYTHYGSRRAAPLTHLQVADAMTKIDQAEFHANRPVALVDAKAPRVRNGNSRSGRKSGRAWARGRSRGRPWKFSTAPAAVPRVIPIRPFSVFSGTCVPSANTLS